MNEVRDAYTDWAATYDTDRNRTRDLDERVTRAALAAGGRRWGRVVETGCGTGKNTVWLADAAESVLALDFSEGMLAKAREKTAGRGNVAFAVADLSRPGPWPQCPRGSADLVVCSLVLEHVADLGPFFAEAARVLAPGGGLLRVCELHPFRQYGGTRANFARADGTAVRIPAFVHHLSDFARAARASGLALASFDEAWHDEDDPAGPPRLAAFAFRAEG